MLNLYYYKFLCIEFLESSKCLGKRVNDHMEILCWTMWYLTVPVERARHLLLVVQNSYSFLNSEKIKNGIPINSHIPVDEIKKYDEP